MTATPQTAIEEANPKVSGSASDKEKTLTIGISDTMSVHFLNTSKAKAILLFDHRTMPLFPVASHHLYKDRMNAESAPD